MKTIFNISEDGDLCECEGVNIRRADDDTIHMSQPQFIKSKRQELNFNDDTKAMTTPAPLSSTILKPGHYLEPHIADWHYCRIKGKLNFICSSCRPKAACAVHQAARI